MRQEANVIRELEKRLSEFAVVRPGQCVICRDGRLVAQGSSPAAHSARRYGLCQRCYNDHRTRARRREQLGLGPWRRRKETVH